VIKEKVGENKQSNIRKIKKILLKRPQIERRKRKRNKKNLRVAAVELLLGTGCSPSLVLSFCYEKTTHLCTHSPGTTRS
jgi:hypothetical protein